MKFSVRFFTISEPDIDGNVYFWADICGIHCPAPGVLGEIVGNSSGWQISEGYIIEAEHQVRTPSLFLELEQHVSITPPEPASINLDGRGHFDVHMLLVEELEASDHWPSFQVVARSPSVERQYPIGL